jgi:hypothetical protein
MQGTNMAPDISPEEACVAGAKAARDTLAASKHPIFLMDEMCDTETDAAFAMGWNSIWACAENKARFEAMNSTQQ